MPEAEETWVDEAGEDENKDDDKDENRDENKDKLTTQLANAGGCVAGCDVVISEIKDEAKALSREASDFDEDLMIKIYQSGVGKWVLGFLRRCWSLSPILLGMFNTVTTIQSIATSLAMIQPDKTWAYGQGTFFASSQTREPDWVYATGASSALVNNVMTGGYYQCAYSQPTWIKMGCDPTVYTVYLVFIVIWVAYFGTLGIYHFLFSIQYSTFDLRYYLSVQLANCDKWNMRYIVVGHLFTLATCVTGWVFCVQNLNKGIPGQTEAAQSIGVFGVLNFLALVPFSNALFNTTAVSKPVKIFFEPTALASLVEGSEIVAVSATEAMSIKLGSTVTGNGIEDGTIVMEVCDPKSDHLHGFGDTNIRLSTKATITAKDVMLKFLPDAAEMENTKGRYVGIHNAHHYDYMDPEEEKKFKMSRDEKDSSSRKESVKKGDWTSLIFKKPQQSAIQLKENGFAHGFEKVGVIALRQLRITPGFVNEALGVDITCIPEDKNLLNLWGAALNVEAVFAELKEKVMRMSMIEEFIRNPKNGMLNKAQLPAYDPTDPPPIDLFTLPEMKRLMRRNKERLKDLNQQRIKDGLEPLKELPTDEGRLKELNEQRRKKGLLPLEVLPDADKVPENQKPLVDNTKQFAVYESVSKMFEVLYMAEIDGEDLTKALEELRKEGKRLADKRKEDERIRLEKKDAEKRKVAETLAATNKAYADQADTFSLVLARIETIKSDLEALRTHRQEAKEGLDFLKREPQSPEEQAEQEAKRPNTEAWTKIMEEFDSELERINEQKLEIHTTLKGFQNPHLKPGEINRIMGTFKATKNSQSGALHNFFYTSRQKAAAEPEPEPELRDSDPSKTAEPAPKSYLDGLMESFFGTTQIPSINCTMEPLQGSSNAAAAAVPIISGGVELVEDSKV